MQKVFIAIGGGLGDLYRSYFTDEHRFNKRTHGEAAWGRLLGAQHRGDLDNFEITVIGAVHNIKQCEEFLKLHPLIHDIDLRPWTHTSEGVKAEYREKGYININGRTITIEGIQIPFLKRLELVLIPWR